MKRFILSLLVVANVIVLTSCHKDRNDLILGSWANTDESIWYKNLPAGIICLKFKASGTVEVDDKKGCLSPGKQSYFISDDTLVIYNYGRFLINSLDDAHMVLTPYKSPGEWYYWPEETLLDFEREK